MTITVGSRSEAGLSTAEVARRMEQDGPNVVPRPRPPSVAGRAFRQLVDPLVLLLIGALAVTVVVRDLTDAAIIALVIVANTSIGVAQEVRAERAIAALDALAAPTARVVRDGRDLTVPAAELVRDDVVRLEAGSIVPADLRLTTTHRLRLDESALTGESVPVSREIGTEASAGTVVVSGRASGLVVRTGPHSALGRIASMVAAARPGPTPLQRRLAGLSRWLGLAVVALSTVVLVIGLLAGRPPLTMAITAVSLVVAAVPESLPAVVTLALALSARRMASRRAIPRRLHAVETLGSVTVVASDKTGTLTENRMSVRRGVDGAGDAYVVTGVGYAPEGSVTGASGAGPSDSLRAMASAAALCSDASLVPPSKGKPDWQAIGDPLEAALLAFAGRCGLSVRAERAAWPRVAEQPFDASLRRMTTLHRAPDGRWRVICKGAPEAIVGLLKDAPDWATTAAAELADAGLRVLAVAAADHPADHEPPVDPSGLELLGLVGIGDPVRARAVDTARAFDDAGIRLLLITGDHPATATSVAGEVGIWRTGEAVHHGADGTPDDDRADRTRVFARIEPDQKLDIVEALQRRGHVVAMTGDGVNDAAALRRADIGVAMGGGTEVARQAADLVLVDDNLATMTVAVREGRRIYDNIRRFLHYGLSGGVAELMVMLAGPFLGLTIPLLPAQILWINLLTHGIPGVALGAEPAEPGVMRRPPRPPQESVLGAGLARAVGWTGLALAVTTLAVGLTAAALGWPWQTMLFLVLGLGQLGIALAIRARRSPGGDRNRALPLAVLLSVGLLLAAVLVPVLRELLGTAPLTVVQILGCLVMAGAPAGLLLAARRLADLRSRHTEP